MKRLITMLMLTTLLSGCATFTTNTYHAEVVSTDLATSAVHAFNLYYQASTNGASVEVLAKLNEQRDTVYDASHKLSATLSVLDGLRLSYTKEQSDTTKSQIKLLLSAVNSQADNISKTVTLFISK